MSQEKKLVLFFAIVFLWMMGSTQISRFMGWLPPPKKPPAFAANDAKPKLLPLPDAAAKPETDPPAPRPKALVKAEAGPAGAKPPKEPEIELVKGSELVLGSTNDRAPGAYRVRVQLEQKGAGVDSVDSALYDAEFEFGKPRKRPLEFISRDTKSLPSMALNIGQGGGFGKVIPDKDDDGDLDKAAARRAAGEAVEPLDSELWEVVRENGKVVRAVTGQNRETNQPATGQAIVFRTTAKSGVVVTKTYRLFPDTDGFELELKFESPGKERSTVYHLLGPHGIPIEGIWYTGTFREVFFGQLGQLKPDTYAASDIAGAKEGSIENTEKPIRFVGVENQYFAVFLEPDPMPTGQENRWDSRTVALVLRKDEKVFQSDVGAEITSRPITVRPDEPVVHTYRVFTGPKTYQALHPYGAEALASYRKNQWIPFAPDIARVLITPTLEFTYNVTERVARVFGGKSGNYGIAIILLTIIVRGLMFPLGRKQARSAQKMQSLQPLLKELQEKYKEDKEKLTKETFALYKRHGVNPVSGCLPALIQLPIFVGLWQALNTSFFLRHANFLWIRDLAAPDMLFHIPIEIPYVTSFLGQWFNVLPFIVIALMLFQTKLFAPPATTPEAEMQQKMMKYMMVFMGVMFYKVPSGLGIYFITSSLWAIGERLLLPKVGQATEKDPGGKAGLSQKGASAADADSAIDGPRGSSKQEPERNGDKDKPPGALAQFWSRMLDEARKDPTYRKIADDRDGDKDREPERGRERERDRPRPKPRRR